MQKVIVSLFLGLGYGLQALKKPATWGVLLVVGGLWWWRHQSTEAGKVVNREAPVEFKALAVPSLDPAPAGVPGAPAALTPSAAVNEEIAIAIAAGITDPEKLPVMSSRDLEVAVGRFHLDNLRLPKDADELIEQKYLVGVPPAPPGKRYFLDLAPIRMRLVSK